MLYHDNVIFIHIPKTGGQSIFSFLDSNNLNNWKREFHARHDPLFHLQALNDLFDVFKFTVVRNPFRRAFSYYKHFNRQNNLNVSLKEFFRIIKDQEYYENTPMIFYPQSFYLCDENGDFGVDKIYRFENLAEFEKDFNCSLSKLNVGNYNYEEYIDSYTEKNKNFVREYYYCDFVRLKYSFDFV
jgi:hypothetical protein